MFEEENTNNDQFNNLERYAQELSDLSWKLIQQCPKCRGVGFLPSAEGPQACECRRKLERIIKIVEGNVPRKFWNILPDYLKLSKGHDKVNKICANLSRLHKSGGSVYLIGSGRTATLSAVTIAAIDKELSAIYFTMADWMALDYAAAHQLMRQYDLVALDDFTVRLERPNVLHRLVNEIKQRQANCQLTFVAGEDTPKGLTILNPAVGKLISKKFLVVEIETKAQDNNSVWDSVLNG